MDAHIQVKNLNAFYGKNQSLKNINIEVPKKQITVIMGASGCGKTTLLKTFNRFLELTDGTRITGEVLVDGETVIDPGALAVLGVLPSGRKVVAAVRSRLRSQAS